MLISIRKILFLSLMISLYSQQNSSDIYSTQNFYSIKTLGLSGSNTAINNDPKDALTNSASFSVNHDVVSLNIQPYIVDTYFYHLTYATKNKKMDMNLVYGLSGFVSSDFENRDIDGLKIGTYDNREMIFHASANKAFDNNAYRIGIATKYVYSKLFDYNSSAILLDLGLQLNLDQLLRIPRSIFGFTITDVEITKSEYHLVEEDKKQYLNFGYSYKIEKIPVHLMFNHKILIDEGLNTNAYGVMYNTSNIQFTVSYLDQINASLEKETDREVLNGFSFGLSIPYNDFSYAFAYRSLSDLGDHLAFGISKTLN